MKAIRKIAKMIAIATLALATTSCLEDMITDFAKETITNAYEEKFKNYDMSGTKVVYTENINQQEARIELQVNYESYSTQQTAIYDKDGSGEYLCKQHSICYRMTSVAEAKKKYQQLLQEERTAYSNLDNPDFTLQERLAQIQMQDKYIYIDEMAIGTETRHDLEEVKEEILGQAKMLQIEGAQVTYHTEED